MAIPMPIDIGNAHALPPLDADCASLLKFLAALCAGHARRCCSWLADVTYRPAALATTFQQARIFLAMMISAA